MQSLAFGLPDVPVRMGAWALKLVDRLILQSYVPLSVVGLYSVGYTLGSALFEVIASSVNSAILPFVYRTARDEPESRAKRIFAALAAYDAALLAFLALAAILFAREVLVVLAAPDYLAAETVVALVAWASVFQCLTHVPTRAVYLAKRTGSLPVVLLVPALLNIGLNLALVPRHGMMGAAWATLLAYPVMLALSAWAAQRAYPIPYDYGRIAKPLAIALVLSLAKAAIPTEPIVVAVSLKALVLGTFPLALLASGFLGPEERAAVTRLASRVAHAPSPVVDRREP